MPVIIDTIKILLSPDLPGIILFLHIYLIAYIVLIYIYVWLIDQGRAGIAGPDLSSTLTPSSTSTSVPFLQRIIDSLLRPDQLENILHNSYTTLSVIHDLLFFSSTHSARYPTLSARLSGVHHYTNTKYGPAHSNKVYYAIIYFY